MTDASTGRSHGPVPYEIRVKGALDPRWVVWFDGLSLDTDGEGTTVLHGTVVDQSALYGVLRKLRDLGLPLLSVTQVAAAQPAASTDEPR